MKWCIYDYAHSILKYPLVALFLLDFHFNWKRTETELRGDNSTNISGGSALYLGWLGGLLRRWHR